MKLGFAMLADAAQASQDGKVSIIGGDFDTIYSASFPAMHPVLTLVLRLDFELSESNREHRMNISLTGPLGRHIVATDPRPFTPTTPDGYRREYLKTVFVVSLNGLVFEQQGQYKIRINVDSTTVGELPLYLERLQSPAAPAGGIMLS